MSRALHSRKYQKLRLLLRAARLEAELTQSQLAAKVGRPQSFVAKYEGGELRLDVIDFLEICSALDLEPGAVLGALP